MTKSERNSRVTSLLSKFNSPVIVTFDASDQVVDTFGDLSHYHESPDGLKDALSSMLVGWSEHVHILPDVEMPTGRFASIKIVPEGELRHVVLTDVTFAVIEQRGLLQASHETVLAERRERVALEEKVRRASNASPSCTPISDLLAWDVRARINEIFGYARIADSLSATSAQSHAISSIKRATFHLHALSLACASRLPEAGMGCDSWEPVNVEELLAEIGEQIGKVTLFDSRVDIEVKADGVPDVACLPYEKVKQVLCCMVSCMLDRCDGMAKFAASAVGHELVFELRVAPEPGEGRAPAPEDLVEQLQSDIRFESACGLIRQMKGAFITFREGIAAGLRITIPVSRASANGVCRTRAVGSVLVAIDDEHLLARVTDQLAHIDVPSRRCADIDELEASASAGGIVLIILGGRFSEARGIGAIYRMHGRGIRVRALVIKCRGSGPAAWVFDGRRTLVSTDADDGFLRSAIEGALTT